MGKHHPRHAKPAPPVIGAAGITALAVAAPAIALAVTPAHGFQAVPDIAAQPAVAVLTAEVHTDHDAVHVLEVKPAARHARPVTVTVRPGDYLSKIAGAVCGNPGRWPAMFDANKGLLTNPDVIDPGQVLKVSCDPNAPVPAPPAPKVTAPVTETASTAPATPQSRSITRQYTSGSAASAYSAFPGAACIVTAESGGNPRAVNPSSGAGGLFQDLPSTWIGLGGYGLPEDAPVAEQIALNVKLYQEAGLSPWAADGCPGT